jgi:hypothetical protein
VEGEIEIEPPSAPLVSVLPDRPINPMLEESCLPVVIGGTVRFAWSGIEGDPLVSVYYLAAFDAEADVRMGQLVYVDQAEGDEVLHYVVQPDDPTGLYYVLVGSAEMFVDPPYAPPCFEVVNAPTPTPPVGD